MTAVLTVGDPPMIAQYLTREPDAVTAFLARYPFLQPLLTDALGPLRAAFGPEPSFMIAVDIDPEVVGWEELRVDVETTLPVDEADQCLEVFDTAWWLEHLPRAQGKLFFTLAFV